MDSIILGKRGEEANKMGQFLLNAFINALCCHLFFCLLHFSFGKKGGQINKTSSASQDCLITMMEFFVGKFTDPPTRHLAPAFWAHKAVEEGRGRRKINCSLSILSRWVKAGNGRWFVSCHFNGQRPRSADGDL